MYMNLLALVIGYTVIVFGAGAACLFICYHLCNYTFRRMRECEAFIAFVRQRGKK